MYNFVLNSLSQPVAQGHACVPYHCVDWLAVCTLLLPMLLNLD
eukprot:COSAG01_NODE_60091_length_296_cov_1.289340_1_plen_42_part_01